MTTYFWPFNKTGVWDTSTANWRTTTDASHTGTGGAGPPTLADAAVFDANSGTSAVTASASQTPVALSLTCTGFTGTLNNTTGNNATLILAGSCTLAASVLAAGTGFSWVLGLTASGTLTSAANAALSTVLASGGTTTLADSLALTGGLQLSGSSTFNANNHAVTASSVTAASGTTLDLGTAQWTITGTSTAWNVDPAATVSASTSTLEFNSTANNALTFAGGGHTYNEIFFTRGSSTGVITVTGSNTFGAFIDNGSVGHTLTLQHGTTQTVTALTVAGSAGNSITINSDSPGTAATISQASGTVASSFLYLRDNHATGGATFNATQSASEGNVTGWNVSGVSPFVLSPAII